MRGKVTLQDVPCDSVGITPRVCGEKAEQIKKSSADTGSPPHVRGKRQDRLDYYVPQGSPPRMRGKVPFSIECGFCRGITPAYAGKR